MIKADTTADAHAELLNDLIFRIQMAQALGPLYGADPGRPIRKLVGFDDLWETRVRHASGMYRQFFRFASIAGEASAVFIDGATKSRRRLPRHVLEAAERRLNEYAHSLDSDPKRREHDLVRGP